MTDQSYTHLSYNLTAGWQFRQAGKPEWYSANVPGCIHLDLLQNKLIEDPFYRDNEEKVQWIDKEDWEYQLTFDVLPEIYEKQHVQLIFEGLDTYADVYLNEKKILEADNIFRLWRVDVKSVLNEKQNNLFVKFRSPIQEILPKLEKISHKLPAMNDLKIGTNPYTRKAPYHFGWDWGPRLVTSGIWQPIKIEAWDQIKIMDVQINLINVSSNRALLKAKIELLSDIAETALIKISDDINKNEQKEKINVEPGINSFDIEFEIIDPELWWPSGYGEQPLYTIQTEVSTKKQRIIFSKRIGIRMLELQQQKDQWGESFTFVVNGVPIFAKGANWIPADSFTPRVSEEKYRYLLSSAVNANMNMIRVWGGGIYESDIFYDICDELGIFIWQDFMFSCALYPGDEKFLKSVRAEATDQIRRLRHHPCIALWCGNNEIEMGWQDWGFQEKMPASFWEDYLKLFHHVLPQVCEREDPTRKYWPSSPASDTISVINPNDATHGDTHYWGVWHGRESFDFYEKHFPRFISEYGFQSFPEPESVNKFTIKDDQEMFSPVMLTHQKNERGNSIIKEYLEKNYIVPNDFNQFLQLSQVLQAEGMKIAAEHFRRIRPRCMGSLYWQLNDCWPVTSWSSIDYYGRWKALQYYARRFYAPILISPHIENDAYKFYVVSDAREQLTAQLRIQLLNCSGEVCSSCEKVIEIRPGQSTIYHSIPRGDIPDFIDSKETFIYCILHNDKEMIAENALYFDLPKNLKLNKPEINFEIEKQDYGFSISLISENLARSVILNAEGIDGRFEDNFFDLYPRQKRTVRFVSLKEIEKAAFKETFNFITLFDLMERNNKEHSFAN